MSERREPGIQPSSERGPNGAAAESGRRVSAFTVTSEHTVVRAGFLQLVTREILGPDGDVHERNVVKHPGAVVVVPVDADGEHAWCVRQYRVAADASLLEIPAGKREPGEAPEYTAARELDEELGMVAGRLVKLCEFYNSPGFCDEYTYLFAALDLQTTDTRHELRAEEREMTVERVAFADVPNLIASGALVDAKSIAGLLLAARLVDGAYTGMTGRAE
jgi:ADP-ribose diphosphatase